MLFDLIPETFVLVEDILNANMKYSFFEAIDETEVRGFYLTKLNIDEAYVKVVNEANFSAYVYQVHKECHKCLYELVSTQTNFTTTFQYKFKVAKSLKRYITHNAEKDVICDLDPSFGEFGVYEINIEDEKCNVATIAEPVNAYLSILTVFLIYAAAFIGIYGLKHLIKCFQNHRKDEEKPPKKIRVKSLDTFRGIAIVIMIFANFGCGSYDFCDHSIWNGLHIADLVFPWFMWIMGVCIPLSIESSFKKNIPRSVMVKNVIKRSVKLFCLGLFLSSSTALDYLRIFGVLQRFGVCYFVCSLLCIFFMKTNVKIPEKNSTKHFMDIIRLGTGWIVALALLTIHCLIVFLVADEGCPVGYLGPGGLHYNGLYKDCAGGATGFIDRWILRKHTFSNPTIKTVYNVAQPFDPEGIVGCLTSIFQVFIGVQAGSTLITYKTHSERLVRWLLWAAITGLSGGGFCGFSKYDGVIPINKNLWSLSFVLVTSCFAFALLSFCYFIVDVKRKWSGKPFLYAGMNAIIMYIGHEMTFNNFPVRWRLEKGKPHPTHFIALLENVWGTLIWIAVSFYLYKIEYFFTI